MIDVDALQDNHPLRVAKARIEAGETPSHLRKEQWKNLETVSKGNNPTTSRYINVDTIGGEGKGKKFPRFLQDGRLDPALKRTMMRWCVYKYPVRYKPTATEKEALGRIRNTDDMDENEYARWQQVMLKVFND